MPHYPTRKELKREAILNANPYDERAFDRATYVDATCQALATRTNIRCAMAATDAIPFDPKKPYY